MTTALPPYDLTTTGRTVRSQSISRTAADAWDRARGLWWVGGAVILSVLLRIARLRGPIHPDEALFGYIGRGWGRGETLYTDVFVDRPQLGLLTFRFLNVFGDYTSLPLRVFMLVWGAGLIVALAWLLRELGASWQAVGIAAVTLGWLASLPMFEGEVVNGELLAALPGTIGLALGARAIRTGRLRVMIGAGVAGGCAVLFKQSGIDATVALGLWLLVRRGAGPIRARIWHGVVLGFGLCLPLLLAAAHGAHVGFDRWMYAMIGSRDEQNGLDGYTTLLWRLWISLQAHAPGLIGAAVGLLLALVYARRIKNVGLLWAWLATGAMAAISGGSFWSHYYLALFPCIAGLTGYALTAQLGRRNVAGAMAVASLLVLPTVAFGPSLIRADFTDKYKDSVAVAKYVRANVPAADSVLHLHSGNVLAGMSDRHIDYSVNLFSIRGTIIEDDVDDIASLFGSISAPKWITIRSIDTWPKEAKPVTDALRRHYEVAFQSNDTALLARRAGQVKLDRETA